MRRVVITLVAVAGAIVLAVGVIAIWALRTESGARFIVNRAIASMPGSFAIQQIDGYLAGPLLIQGLTLQTDNLDIAVGRAALEWQPTALLNRQLNIERLTLVGIVVTQRPREAIEATEPRAIPDDLSLPVDVTIDALRIDSLEYLSAANADPIVVDDLSLAARSDREAIAVHALNLVSPTLELSGSAAVTVRAPHTAAGELAWTFDPIALPTIGLAAIDLPAVAGTTRFAGTIDDIEINQTLAAPYNMVAAIWIEDLLNAPRIGGRANFDTVATDIRDDLPFESVSAEVNFDGAINELAFTGNVDVDDSKIGPFGAAVAGRYLGERFDLSTLELTAPNSPVFVSLAGEVDVTGGPRFDIDAAWDNAQWPLRGDAAVVSPTGTATINGAIDDYTLQATADVVLPNATAAQFALTGRGDTMQLTLDQVSVQTFEELQLAGTAEVHWRPEIEMTAEMQGAAIDPALWFPSWPGNLDARLLANASYDADGLRVIVEELAAGGELRERPLSLNAQGRYSEDAFWLEQLTVESAESTAEIAGRIGSPLDLEWSIDSPDLGDLWPGATGRLESQGAIDGNLSAPRITAEALGENVALGAYATGSVSLSANMDLTAAGSSTLILEAGNARLPGIRIEELALTGEGPVNAHVIALDVQSDLFVADIDATGNWDRQAQSAPWLVNIARGTIAYPSLPAWQLAAPTTLRIDRDRTELDQHCWQYQNATACLAGRYAEGSVFGQFELADLPFAYFASLLPPDIELDGDLNAAGSIEPDVSGTALITANIESSTGTLLAPQADSDALSAFDFGPIRGDLHWAETGLSATLSSDLQNDGRFEFNAELTGSDRPFADRDLSGRLLVSADDLGFAADLSSELQTIEGSMTSDLALSGTPAAPRLSGELRLDGRRVALRTPGIEMEDLALVVGGDGLGNLTVDASARSGPGTLNASGNIGLGNDGPRGRFNLTGENFEAINTPGLHVLASPDVNALLGEDTIELSGTLVVPEAAIAPPETSTTAATVSPDQIIVADDSDDAGRRTALRLFAALRVELGERVTVDGFGLQGRLAGNIALNERPNEPVTANGELRVEGGTYEAYGQELEIQTGRLLFAGGPINNPGLDVEAVRRPTADITVGARVRGTLINPVFTVFSTPSMPRQDQLGYLVLGRSLESSSTSEASALSRAALALGLKGGNFVSDRISQNLGFDEFGFQSRSGESSEEAAFVIGKYLAPSLYVSYGIGLFDSLSTLTLRYAISNRWELSTESSSEANGGDVLFTIERGE